MEKLVNSAVLEAAAERLVGSSPTTGTKRVFSLVVAQVKRNGLGYDFEVVMNYADMIGKKVAKIRKRKYAAPKPFKSGLKANTVKGIVNHPILNIPAFTFIEDDSYVECRRCKVVDWQETV